MKRNFIQRYAPFLFAALLLLTGCAKEDPAGGPDGATRVSFKLGGSAAPVQTRAQGDNGDAGTLAALPDEKRIDNVLALLYRADFPSKGLYQVIEPTLGESGSYEFPVGDAGLYKVYFVANADETLAAAIKGLPKGSQLKDFDALVASQAPDAAGRFLMVSMDGVLIEVRLGSTSAIAEAVRMQRLSARFDIVNKAEGFVITSITFNNRPVRSKLAAGSGTMPGEWFERKVYTPESPFVGSLDNPTSYEAKIYSYENYAVSKGSSQLSSLEIAYTDRDGKSAVHTVGFFDPKSDPFDPTPLALKRNYLYRIVLTEEASVECELQVEDWDEAERFDVKNLPVTHYPYVRDGRTIVVRDDKGQADPTLYAIHEPWCFTPSHSEAEWDANASGKNAYAAAFRIAKADALRNSGYAGTMTWFEAVGIQHLGANPYAYSACSQYSEEYNGSDKGLWRLPTIVELKLIFDKKDDLPALNLPSELAAFHSATQRSYESSFILTWIYNVGSGIERSSASYNAHVRCVRDENIAASSNYPRVENGNTIVVADDHGYADPTKYPTHGYWYKTPTHYETVFDGSASGFNTFGRKFLLSRYPAYNKNGYRDVMTWYEATGTWHATYNPSTYSACKQYSESTDRSDEGQWRLPTQREVSLMYEFRKSLTPSGLSLKWYWCGTFMLRENPGSWWWEDDINGIGWHFAHYIPSDKIYTRCVRDL